MKFTVDDFFVWLATTKRVDRDSRFDDNGNEDGYEIREDKDGLYWRVDTSSGWDCKPWKGYCPHYISGESGGWDREHISVRPVKKIVYVREVTEWEDIE